MQCEVDGFTTQQVFRNLLENALAACEDPVEIEVEYADAQLSGPAALQVTIRDNGPGLSVGAAKRFFDAFYTTKAHGSGLGISIAKRILDKHGGQLAAARRRAHGAEFLLTFPRKQAPE